MVNTEIRLIIFFAAKNGALYSQQKQDQELTVAQIMNSLLPNSDLNYALVYLNTSQGGNVFLAQAAVGMVAEYCKMSHFQKISEVLCGGTHRSGHQVNLIPLGVHLWPPLVPVGGTWSSPLVTAAVERHSQPLVPRGAMGSHPGSCVCSPLQAGNLRLTLVPWEGIVATQPSLSKREGTCYHLRLQATGMQTYGHSGTTRGASFGSHGGDPRMPRCIRKGTLEAQQRMTGTD